MRSRPYKQVDVFTAVPYLGNPVAVVLEAEGLTPEQMQRIARWTNLSETTFVLPPTQGGADYRLRIYTPNAELPFAGHPTIGSAHALLEAGVVAAHDGRLVQQCGAGLVNLAVEAYRHGERWISFELPQPTITPLSTDGIAELEAALGCAVRRDLAPRLVDVGPRWVVAQLAGADEVLAVRPDYSRLALHDTALGATGVAIFGEHRVGGPARIEVRAFAPTHGVDEDPVCGSGNGCVAAFIRDTGQTGHYGPLYTASQGAALGRAGRLRIGVNGGIRVGGQSVTCIEGRLAA
jgi:PhzF family phenazine biosynthesis protein